MKAHWALWITLLTTVACGNGNTGTPSKGVGGSGGTRNGVGGEHAVGVHNDGGAEQGAEASGGAAGISGAEDSAGAAGVSEQPLADGPGAADAEFDSSPMFVTRMRQPMTGLPSSPHGIVQIFYSSNIEPILGQESFSTLPVGTVALKMQDRDGDGAVDQIMLMVKKPAGELPNYGDWAWEQRDSDTFELVTSSATDPSFGDFCASCHRGFSATDWLGGTSLSN